MLPFVEGYHLVVENVGNPKTMLWNFIGEHPDYNDAIGNLLDAWLENEDNEQWSPHSIFLRLWS